MILWDFLNIKEFFMKMIILLVGGIYKIAGGVYQVFLILAKANIFSQSDYRSLADKIYVILGVAMLFIIAYNFLVLIVDPDKDKNGGNIGKMLKDTLIAFILIVITPSLFSFAFDVQNSILDQNTIGKLFVRGNLENDTHVTNMKNGGNIMAATTFRAFFYPVDDNGEIIPDEQAEAADWWHSRTTITQAQEAAEKKGSYWKFSKLAEEVVEDHFEFHWVVAIIAGCYLIYVLLNFVFDLALRVVKLAFYQIMAPICISCKVLPKGESIFNNWWKAVSKTFLSLFARIFVMNLSIYLISIFIQNEAINTVCTPDAGCGTFAKLLAKALIIMGIVTFMRQSSKIIDEIFGLGDGTKLGLKDRLKDGGAFALGNALGTFGAAGWTHGREAIRNIQNANNRRDRLRALASGIGGTLWHAGKAGVGGAAYGMNNTDMKRIGQARINAQNYVEARQQGSSTLNMIEDEIRGAFGFESSAAAHERAVKNEARVIPNNSRHAFTYYDQNGDEFTILPGRNFNGSIADLDAQIQINKGEMSDAANEMARIDEEKALSDAQKGLLSFYEDDADKSWEKGKFKHLVRYLDRNGVYHEAEISKQEFDKIREDGATFYRRDVSNMAALQGQYQQITYTDAQGVAHTETIHVNDIAARIQDLQRNNATNIANAGNSTTDQILSHLEMTNKNVLDAARRQWTQSELSTDGATGAKAQWESFMSALADQEFNFQNIQVNPDGTYVRDQNGVIQNRSIGTMTSAIDAQGRRVVTKRERGLDDHGQPISQETTYVEIGNGQLQRVIYNIDNDNNRIGGPVSTATIDIMDLADELDKKAKSTSAIHDSAKQAVLTTDQYDANGNLIRRAYNTLDRENKAMESVKQAHSEQEAAELQTREQRNRQLTDKYRAGRK